MANPGFIKNFDAATSIAPHRIVAMFSNDFAVRQANGVAQPIIGLSEHGNDNNAIADRCDVVMSQTGEVEFGATIAPGQQIVTDAEGKAIPFDKAAYVEDNEIWVLGTALEGGDAGTIGTVTINPFLIVK